MARSVAEIKKIITDAVQGDPVLNTNLTSTSTVALWNLMAFAVSFGWNILERLFDTIVLEINTLLSTLKPHTLRWYVTKVKAFQYGYSLPIDTDVYDNSLLTDAAIAASLIIQYAAGTRQRRINGRLYLRIKVATLSGSDLGPISGPQLTALSDYVFRVADAGVDYDVTTGPADRLVQVWDVYYDPEILDNAGNRIDGTVSSPVRNGIKDYLLNLPFNGEFRNTYHTDAVQAIAGVTDCQLKTCQASYGALPLTSIPVSYIPDAGYMRFLSDADLVINYIPLSPII
jgi:hypothetical protein